MGIVRVSGRGQFVCRGWVVMTGWRCPEANASSRWLIVIRTDLFLPTPTMIAVRIRMCAARAIRWRKAQLIGQTDPFGTPAKPPLPCSRGPISARNTPPRRKKRARPLGRRHGCSAPGRKPRHSRNTKSRSRSTSRAPCILCTATRPCQPQRQNRTITKTTRRGRAAG